MTGFSCGCGTTGRLHLPATRKSSIGLLIILLLALPQFSAFYPSQLSSQATSSPPESGPTAQLSATVEQSPSTVSSLEPVFVFAQLSIGNTGTGPTSNLTLLVNISISCSTNSTYFGCPFTTVNLPAYSLAMLPYWNSKGTYFSVIPPLLTTSFVIDVPCLSILLLCPTAVTLSSTVSYEVYLNNQIDGGSSYYVNQMTSNLKIGLPPLVGAFVKDSVDNPALFQETYGLSTSGWVAGPNEQPQLVLFSLGQGGIRNMNGYYSVSGGIWAPLSLSPDSIQSTITGAISSFNNLIVQLNAALSKVVNYTLPTISVPIQVEDATMPQVPLGNYVMFKANATDNMGYSATSPEGFYYIVNKASPVRVLAVDPHVELWMLLQNLKMYSSAFQSNLGYEMPSQTSAQPLLQVSQLLNNFEAGQFHYWNLIGENYNLTISYPDQNLVNLLKPVSSGGFGPNAVYLSDLSLGFQSQGTVASQFFNWDLSSISDGNGNTVVHDLINYVKTYHAALIGSAGTMSDWQIWTGCNSQSAIEIGARGDIGSSIKLSNPMSESTLAPMFGLGLLPLFENVRDQIAALACSVSGPVGDLLGSTPLLVPNVPWNGTLENPNYLPLKLNSNENIMSGIDKINIAIPGYQSLGFGATNTIGWQLSMPIVAADAAWSFASQASSSAAKLGQDLTELSQNITGGSVSIGDQADLGAALNSTLADLFGSIASANINATGLKISISLPNIGNRTFFIPVSLNYLESMIPVGVAAISPDYSAGIITYDKYFDSSGYRSVYFSFSVASSDSPGVSNLISNAISWASQWQYRSPQAILGGLFAPSGTVQTLQSMAQSLPGSVKIANASLLLNEGGNTSFSFQAPFPANYTVGVYSPYSKTVLNAHSPNKVLGSSSKGYNVSTYTVQVKTSGAVELLLSADAESSLNAVYLEVVQPPPPVVTEIRLSASPSTVAEFPAQFSVLTATVFDQYGNPMQGISVTFSTTQGSLSPLQAVTNSQGQASVQLKADQNTTSSVSDVVTAVAGNNVKASTIVTLEPGGSTSETGSNTSSTGTSSSSIGTSSHSVSRTAASSNSSSQVSSPGGGRTPILLIALAVMVVVVIAASAILINRRKRSP